MKKLIIIPLMSLILCGCNNYNITEMCTDKNTYTDMTIDTDKDKYIQLFNNIYGENKNNTETEIKNLIKSLPLADISITQKGQPTEKVSVYKSTNPDFLLAYADDYYQLYAGSTTTSTKYESLINKYKEKGWHLSSCITGSTLDRIKFCNDEYLIANENSGMFNLRYDNVYLNSDNIPIEVALYITDNKVSKIYINYYSLTSQKKDLSLKNINMLRDSLEIANINDFDVIINNLQAQIKENKIIDTDLQAYSIKSLSLLNIDKRVDLGALIVTVK